ncbi:ParH-like protein [Streptomyces sp. MST-110588]|uniref:ParH-like protein n=1 Tax=Streptomyces sp. MST-110588 TaxID=2833628 RepID=UPI001F5C6E9D|nr:ParH-like protein [Streptomyces sp. MST-110588]UNO43026.1 ParH-like protein [Streptomyces sp. MST-110588]
MKFARRRDRVLADCSARLRDLPIPRPFELGAFLGHLAERRGRPIRLEPQVTPPAGPCGLWIATARADYIFYDEATTALHRDHIVLHEVGHMLSGHYNLLSGDTAQALVPGLDTGEVESVLGRSHYSDVEEQEAELIASLILQRADRTVSRRPATSQQAEVLSRMDSVFGSPKRR